MKRCKVMILVLALIIPGVCRADTLSDKGYYAVVLERRNHLQDKSIDAVVFTRSGSRYRFIRRLDEDYRLVLNSASGIEAPAVTAGNFPQFDAMIKGNRLTPSTVRDKNGRELAIVYCGLNPCYIDAQIRRDGAIFLEVRGSLYFERDTFGMFDRAKVKN